MTKSLSLSEKVGHFVVRFRFLILLVNVLIFAGLFMGFAARGKKFGEYMEYIEKVRNNPMAADSNYVVPTPIFNTDYHVFFEDDNIYLTDLDAFQRIFSKEDNLIVVVKAKEGDIFTNENLASIKDIIEKGWRIPWVNRVDGLTNFNYTVSENDDLVVDDFIYELPLSDEELIKKRETALSDPLMPHFLISKEGNLTQISMRVVAPIEYTEAFSEVGVAAKELKKEIEAANPNIEIKLGGMVMLNNAFKDYAMKDMATLFPLMLLLIFVVLFLVSFSLWGSPFQIILRLGVGAIAPMILLMTSVMVPIFLFIGLLQFSLTNISLNVTQMLIAVAIADSVHVMTIFYRGLKFGMDKKEAAIYTIKRNLIACLITSVTTAIGFYSLLSQNMPPFQDLGLFAGTGTIYAFLVSIFTLPAILTLLPFKANPNPVSKEEQSSPNRFYKGLASWIFKRQKIIRLASFILTGLSIYFIMGIEVDSTAVNYFSKETPFRQASEYIDANIIGTNPLEFNFQAEEEGGVYAPAFLKKIEAFQEHVMEDSSVYHITYVSSIVDIIKRLNQSMHGDDKAYYRIPDKDSVTVEGDTLFAKNLIAQYMFLYTMSLPQGMELTNQIDISAKQTRVTAFMTSVSSKKQVRSAEDLTAWLSKNMPELKARAIGVPLMFGKLMGVAIPGMLRSLAISLFLITIVLMFTFRSIRVGLFSMIPNIWPILVIFGVVGLVGYTVNLSVAVVGMITLGIAVDDSVHFIVKYLQNVKDGYKGEDAFSQTFNQVGSPLVFTSVILIMGFGALMLSDFALNFDLGMLCSAVIALALIADFILLPAVILQFQKKES